MDETRNPGGASGAPSGVTLLAVSEEHVDKVLEYLAGLRQKDAEVAGHGMGIPLMKGAAGTKCRTTTIQGVPTPDYYCDDWMTWT